MGHLTMPEKEKGLHSYNFVCKEGRKGRGAKTSLNVITPMQPMFQDRLDTFTYGIVKHHSFPEYWLIVRLAQFW